MNRHAGREVSDGLVEALQVLRGELSTAMRERWDRDLPFEELLADRWERAGRLGFGEGSSIYATAYVYGPVRAGRDVWIGPFVVLDGTGGLTIGDGATISAGVQVYSHDTVRRTLTGGVAQIDRSPVSIGDRSYLGADVIVARGVQIGHHVVIGAGSFVNRDVPDFAVAVGTPCRVIGHVELRGDGDAVLVYP